MNGDMGRQTDESLHLDWAEAFIYRSGTLVELKAKPGTVDTIASYDPTMVPPIELINDPRPRYPHELRLVLRVTVSTADAFAPAG